MSYPWTLVHLTVTTHYQHNTALAGKTKVTPLNNSYDETPDPSRLAQAIMCRWIGPASGGGGAHDEEAYENAPTKVLHGVMNVGNVMLGDKEWEKPSVLGDWDSAPEMNLEEKYERHLFRTVCDLHWRYEMRLLTFQFRGHGRSCRLRY